MRKDKDISKYDKLLWRVEEVLKKHPPSTPRK
jgi:hypothetical protein